MPIYFSKLPRRVQGPYYLCVKDRQGVSVRDQMHLHTFNVTDIICFVIHVLNMTKE